MIPAAVDPSRILADLRHAGFPPHEAQAVRDTPAMWAQIGAFYAAGGRVERVDADFSGATGAPDRIRFFCPPVPQPCAHSNYSALAHELGHALQCPEQWQPPDRFASAQDYARARERGEAHAWLNQYRLNRARADAPAQVSHVLPIENDHDFGTEAVDIFARIAQREAAGWPDTRILDELAVLNANMFPCGMGEGNLKTYGQCNRWDWLLATRARNPAFNAFLQRLPRAPNVNEQKVLMKFNLFTRPAPAQAWPSTGLIDEHTSTALASALSLARPHSDLRELFALTQSAVPQAQPGVALPAGAEAVDGIDAVDALARAAKAGTPPPA